MVVSSTVVFALGRSPNKTFQVKDVNELVVEFWKLEERCSQLKYPTMSICDLLLGLPTDQARLADHLHGAAGQLGVELATWS
jgi:hypothetical protein